jgi:hypothetical protein
MVMVRARLDITGGERAFASSTRSPRGLGAHDPPLRLAGQQLDQRRVQGRCFGVNCGLAEQGWIERTRVGHGILLDKQTDTIS